MNELEIFKESTIKGVADSSDYRILMIDGKAVLAEKFSNPSSTTGATDKALPILVIAIFGAGLIAGIQWEKGASQSKIQNLQTENLILQSKIQKIKTLLDD